MTRAYWNGLRERVVGAVEAGASCRAVAARFGVAVSTCLPSASMGQFGVFARGGFLSHRNHPPGSEDETEAWNTQGPRRESRAGHWPGDAETVFGHSIRPQHSAEGKVGVVPDGLKGEDGIAALCRREGMARSLHCIWSRAFPGAGTRRMAGDAARAATSNAVAGNAVAGLRREFRDLKEVVAEQALATAAAREGMLGDGGGDA